MSIPFPDPSERLTGKLVHIDIEWGLIRPDHRGVLNLGNLVVNDGGGLADIVVPLHALYAAGMCPRLGANVAFTPHRGIAYAVTAAGIL